MRAKLTEKEQATALRKQGYSLSEISAQLGVAKSSISLWVRNVALSPKAKESIERKRALARERASTTNRERVDRKFREARVYGASVVAGAQTTADGARLLCAMMYWCEGVKIRRRELLSFTNSDPQLMRAFLHLLRTGFEIDEKKLRLTVHLHDYHDETQQLRFWSKMTSIPLSQCGKPYRKPHTAVRTREGYQGCARVSYMDVGLGRRLEGIAKAFLNDYGPIG